MLKAQCLWYVAIQMNSSVHSTDLVAILEAIILGTMTTLVASFTS